ncbi:MAG: excinuclease ABC subunit UvrC [Lentisphaeria bacterium]|nr:excinuclease ABC subunit UvrC [Lentisphaeria bacterium]NQZ67756.1 excinuclease ABC subunit UvrC [Lentisphaeria bacterium]
MFKRENFTLNDAPGKPGVYVFRDKLNDVIYVGKAKSLRKRLATYFQPSRERTADHKLRSLISSIAFIELHIVKSEPESLLLESRLIKKYTPRYNIMLRDDKRFLLIKIDMNNPWPRLQLARLEKDDGCLYIGPFPVAGALRDTVNYLTQYFGLRTCTKKIPDEQDYKHCNNDIIRYCSAPCIQKISSADYKEKVTDMIKVLEGDIKAVDADLEEKMTVYASKLNFEMAARMRDVRKNLLYALGRNDRRYKQGTKQNYPGMEAVDELQEILELKTKPRHIECFDISTIMGSFTVASMVCFKDGKPSTNDYRHYRIKTVEGIDDFASMREVVFRRYKRQIEEKNNLPDLIVIDGGKGQLSIAYEVLIHFDIDEIVPVISLAKREEEIFTVFGDESIKLERHKKSLRLVQAIRDEAHRFAITYNRDLRRKRILDSLLDEIPGIGEKRRIDLLKKFGSVKSMRKYDAAEIVKRVPGIGEKLAGEIIAHIKND